MNLSHNGKIVEKLQQREKISELVSEKTLYEKKLAERLKKSLQTKNSKLSTDLFSHKPVDVTKENAIKKAVQLEELRNQHLNKYIRNCKPEQEQYYKVYVE